nr:MULTISPECIES: methyltransferase domain-containing protein [unclassified Mesorhizobium]
MRVLDVGCGAGDVTFLVSEMVGSEGQVIGADRAPAALAAAEGRAAANPIRMSASVKAIPRHSRSTDRSTP